METLLQERDGQIQSLCGHMERLTLEKDSLQQELKGLKIKVGEMNDQLGMLMETIQAKDEVIIKLSQPHSEQSGAASDPGSPSFSKDQQELDVLKVQDETPEVENVAAFILVGACLTEHISPTLGQSPRLQIPEQVPEQRDPGADSITQKCREQRKGFRSKGIAHCLPLHVCSVKRNRKFKQFLGKSSFTP